MKKSAGRDAAGRVRIKSMPREERPREKLYRAGAERLSNGELLAIILGSGTGDSSALALAERLISMDSGGISFFATCHPEELCRIKGVGRARSAQIAASVEFGKRVFSKAPEKRFRICNSFDVAELMMKELRYLSKEVFKVILLNVKNEIISIDDTAEGGLSNAYVHPREVFSNAIRKSANSIVLVHNHPSGNPEPSENDILLTRRLVEAGELLGIRVVDHVIIGDGVFKSII